MKLEFMNYIRMFLVSVHGEEIIEDFVRTKQKEMFQRSYAKNTPINSVRKAKLIAPTNFGDFL